MAGTGVWGRVAHVFVAAALALPVVFVAAVLWISLTSPGASILSSTALVFLGVAFAAVVVWVALLPPVRQVEIATARTLLGVDLPDAAAPTAWASRCRGAVWLVLLGVVGAVIVLGLLYLLPLGVGLLIHPFTGVDQVTVPGRGPTLTTGTGWPSAWVSILGAALFAAALWGVAAAGTLLARVAPLVLGPGLTERVAIAAARERELARANDLAREVHDSVGHTLTAMTLQISAARALASTDPEAADRALATAEDLGRRAQADVDGVVGALRRGTPPPTTPPGGAVPGASREVSTQDVGPPLTELLSRSGLEVEARVPARLELPPGTARAVLKVVREGLTNAGRHGDGGTVLEIGADGEDVVVEIRNRYSGRPRRGRAGLVGLRESVLLAGGRLDAGPGRPAGAAGPRPDGAEGTVWVLRARMPVREVRA